MYVCNVTELEKGLNAVNDDVAEMKESMKRKADLKQLEYAEREVENNLVFYNIPEKSEGDTSNCVAFIQRFIASHRGLQTLCGHVEIERLLLVRGFWNPAHSWTPSRR